MSDKDVFEALENVRAFLLASRDAGALAERAKVIEGTDAPDAK
jgi:hypothetical protein